MSYLFIYFMGICKVNQVAAYHIVARPEVILSEASPAEVLAEAGRCLNKPPLLGVFKPQLAGEASFRKFYLNLSHIVKEF